MNVQKCCRMDVDAKSIRNLVKDLYATTSKQIHVYLNYGDEVVIAGMHFEPAQRQLLIAIYKTLPIVFLIVDESSDLANKIANHVQKLHETSILLQTQKVVADVNYVTSDSTVVSVLQPHKKLIETSTNVTIVMESLQNPQSEGDY